MRFTKAPSPEASSAIALIYKLTTRSDVEYIFQAAKSQADVLAQRELVNFTLGQSVTFPGKHGQLLTGTVKAINRKSITVEVPGKGTQCHMWRVHPTCIQK